MKQILILSGRDAESDSLYGTRIAECSLMSAKYGLKPFTIVKDGTVKQAMSQNGRLEQGKHGKDFTEFDCLYEELSIIPDEILNYPLHKTFMGIVLLGNPVNYVKLAKELPVAVVILADEAVGDVTGMEAKIFHATEDAFLYIIKKDSDKAVPLKLYEKALQIRKESYPFGVKGEYLKAAEGFHDASISAISNDNCSLWIKAIANYYNCLGDYFYYHAEDFLRAASMYFRALAQLPRRSSDREIMELMCYLQSIIIECVALSFEKIGEDQLAVSLARRAADSYAEAGKHGEKSTENCYKHTTEGLKGYSKYLRAKWKLQNGEKAKARELLEQAKRLYAKALAYQPLWKKSGFSDNYEVAKGEIETLEKQLARKKI